ncbi:hypothetical protein PMIN06_010690 [Paraphaeosphaeria minitans]
MAPILTGSPHHTRPCTRKHSFSTRTRQVSPTERRMLSSPGRVARSRALSHQHQDFAPTPNRFSLLADLEPPPGQMKWAFDFVPPPSTPSKRRGKRAGKQKLKYAPKIREARNSDVLGELCDKVAALSLNNSGSTTPTTPTKPRDSVTNTLDTVRHHWAPQFRPEQSLGPTTPHNAFFQPDRIFDERASPSPGHDRTSPSPNHHRNSPSPKHHSIYLSPSHHSNSPSPSHHEESEQKEPCFFPLPALLASPPPAALQIPAGKPTPPITTRNSPTKRSLAEMPSTSAQEAVASAGRALATEETNTAHGGLPLYRFETGLEVGLPIIESLPPITQATGMQRQTQEDAHARALPSVTLPITFPHVASPVLTAPLLPESLPTTWPYRPAHVRPNYVSRELYQPLLKKSWLRADIYKSPHPYTYVYGESHLPSLRAVAGPSSDPSVASLDPSRTSRFDELFRSVYPREFLSMGHGNPCWCSNCPNNVPLGELPGEEVWTTPRELSESLRRGSVPLGRPRRGDNQQPPIGTDWLKRKSRESLRIGSTPLGCARRGDNQQPPIGTGRPRTKFPEPVTTPRSSSPHTLPDGYEEIVRRVVSHVLARVSDHTVPQNDILTMAAPGDGDELFIGSQPSAPPPSRDDYSNTYLPSHPLPIDDDDYFILQPSPPPPTSATLLQQDLVSEPELLSFTTRATVSDYDLASEPEILSYPTPTYELSELTWTARSSPVSLVGGVHFDGSVAEIHLSPIASPAPSPRMSPSVPSAPRSPQHTRWSGEAGSDGDTSSLEDV